MKLTQKEKDLIAIVTNAVKEESRGDPLKDFIEHDEIVRALNLLVKIAKSLDKSS
jgi:hypothetical protein